MNGGDPLAGVGEDQGRAPGARRARRRRARSSSTSSRRFSSGRRIITLPRGEPITVAPTPDFYRWSFASMWTPGPFESKPTRAYYYLTDVDPSWPAERQEEHLRDYNYPTLWSISIHEVYPGPLPALPAPAPRRVEGAQVDHVRAGVVRRRLGALLRADDDRGRLRPARITASSSASSPKRSSASSASSSASGCTPRTCRSSRACGSSATKRSWRKRARGAKPSAARSIRPIWSTASAS